MSNKEINGNSEKGTVKKFDDTLPTIENGFYRREIRIGYISDIHLMHRIKNAGCKTKKQVTRLITEIAKRLTNEFYDLVLIGGDVSSDFAVYEQFVRTLHECNKEKRTFAFVLGNHELWQFQDMKLDDIVNKYRQILEENEMLLLHNALLYMDEQSRVGVLQYDDLIRRLNENIADKIQNSKWLILGGIGFSKYNLEFNANNGAYRATIDRQTEIHETEKFEALYHKLENLLDRRGTVVLTHMPKTDWCSDMEYHDNFVYVSGHTHKNAFHDDGVERIYADNQIGYSEENVYLKDFLLEGKYDCFEYYQDGIYVISPQKYRDFIRGKNMYMGFSRQVYRLHMLKKKGYYCFICESKAGNLSILNGGRLNRLKGNNVNYYYEHMDKMINIMKKPLDKYTEWQQSIANEIRKIGGSGKIHGCIIDIDFYTHIYVNSIDHTITFYWARDMIFKKVYPTLSALLKEKCPTLYPKYQQRLAGKEKSILFEKCDNKEMVMIPEVYMETDIYRTSREIKKMQKIYSNILTIWNDDYWFDD